MKKSLKLWLTKIWYSFHWIKCLIALLLKFQLIVVQTHTTLLNHLFNQSKNSTAYAVPLHTMVQIDKGFWSSPIKPEIDGNFWVTCLPLFRIFWEKKNPICLGADTNFDFTKLISSTNFSIFSTDWRTKCLETSKY